MDKKKSNEELQTRREFFKKAAKGALPIIAGVTLSGCDTFMTAFGDRMSSYSGGGGGYSESGGGGGCGYACSSSCSGGCDGSCQWGCENTCKGTCSSGCQSTCTDGCRWSSR